MKVSLVRSITSALLLGAVASPALAQGQPVGANSRSAGLVVREFVPGLSTASGGVPLMTVTATPGSTYALISQFDVTWFLHDAQSMFPGVVGPLGLNAPAVLSMGVFVDPLGGPVGTIPASGFQDLNLIVPLPASSPATALEVQAMVFDVDGTVYFTNAQIRAFRSTAPLPLGFSESDPYPGSDTQAWDDIEQGDVDGDGDLDRIGISQDGIQQVQVFLYGNTMGLGVPLSEPFLGPTLMSGDLGAPTSAELADLNDDGFLDLAVCVSGNAADYLRIWVNNGLDAAGDWAGFTQLPITSITFEVAGFAADPTDLETGDVDGDGDLDIFMTCALNPAIGQQNRLFLRTGPADAMNFDEVTAANLPAIADDTEDCEFLDYDMDGDLDIVIAVIDASPVAMDGVDYILENQGGAQGGRAGAYLANLAVIPPVDDESTDVVVGDFDADGFPDLYFTNWFETTAPTFAPNVAAPVPDRILMNMAGAVFAAGTPLPAFGDFAGSDAEVSDFDLDGDLDIMVANGSLRNAAALGAPGTTGTRVLINPAVGGGPWANFGGLAFFPPEAAALDLRDIETGDWAIFDLVFTGQFGAQYFDKDVGCAPLGNDGLISFDRD